jgi:hypothetical protein
VGGGGEGAKSFDGEKAWSFINHSILSDTLYWWALKINTFQDDRKRGKVRQLKRDRKAKRKCWNKGGQGTKKDRVLRQRTMRTEIKERVGTGTDREQSQVEEQTETDQGKNGTRDRKD